MNILAPFVQMVILFLSNASTHAGQAETYQSGQSFGSSLLGGVVSAAKSTNPRDVPGFKTDKPSEASLKAGDLGEAAFQASRTNEVAQHLISEAKVRKSFRIDPTTDPLFVGANEVIAVPQKAMDEEFIETTGPDGEASEEVKTCEEAGDETLEECEELRIVTVPEIKKHKSTFNVTTQVPGWGALVYINCNVITGQIWSPYSSGCLYNFSLVDPVPMHLQNRVKCVQFAPGYSPSSPMSLSPSGILSIPMAMHYGGFNVPLEITFSPNEEDVTERIANGCEWLEEKVEKGLCSYEEIQVTEGPQTLIINDYAVTRDWWRRKKIYRCHYPAKNDCGDLRAKGCYQVNSTCKEKVGDACVVWEQTYHCPTGKRSTKSLRSSNISNPYCLTGNCADTSYEANGEMMNVMAQLSALREVQEDLRNYKVIFRGQDRRCTRHCVGFKDCCGSESGWGVTVHLAECDKDEKELRELRDKKLCVQVGTYCAEKKLGICLRKKTSFCCYGTKMARLIQQNGRAQLGIGFGAPDAPNCLGLSTDELSRIDFSRMNFSEIFEDIKNKTVAKDQGQSLAQVSTERLQNNMTLLTKPRINQKQLATKHPNAEHFNAEPLDEKSAPELQQLKEKGF